MLRGGLIHAWFEHVGWIEDGTPDETALRQIAQELLTGGLPGELDVQREAERFARMLRDPNLAALLSRQRYQAMDRLDLPPQVRRDLAAPPALEASVQAERGFAYRDGERLMTGFIDRLVLLRREGKLVAAEIIDYKTDAVDAAQPRQIAERTAFYAPQIAAYRSALARLTGLDEPRILTTLAFVEAGQVVTVRA
jgi:ATP-dependent exoDNAse (exonuclease V) beta subunit